MRIVPSSSKTETLFRPGWSQLTDIKIPDNQAYAIHCFYTEMPKQ